MAKEISKAEGRQSLLLWFGILAAPSAWAFQVVVLPDVTEVLCYPSAGSGRGEIFGFGHEPFAVVLTAALAAVAVLGVMVSLSCMRKLKKATDETPARRASWMALAGVLVSVLFLLGILINLIPMVFLESCQGSL